MSSLHWSYIARRSISWKAKSDQEADYINVAIETSGESYLKIMDEVRTDTRITLIDADGTVIYDSKEDEVTFQNHKNRPEVKASIKNRKRTGYSESPIRWRKRCSIMQ